MTKMIIEYLTKKFLDTKSLKNYRTFKSSLTF